MNQGRSEWTGSEILYVNTFLSYRRLIYCYYSIKLDEKKSENCPNMIYLGIDVSAGKTPYTCVSMDEQMKICEPMRLGIDELLQKCTGDHVVAINAPAKANNGLMNLEEIRQQFTNPPPNGRYTNLRVVDYELLMEGIKVHRVPAFHKDCPVWMKNSFQLFTCLQERGFIYNHGQQEKPKLIEINAEAVFTIWLGIKPYDPKTLEGRLQRQLLLFEKGLDIEDPMEFFQEITRHRLLKGKVPFSMIYTVKELGAMAAALMGWALLNKPHYIETLGQADEGMIYLPKRN